MFIALEGIKKALVIFWEDVFSLVIINIMCFISLVPALFLYNFLASTPSVIGAIVNTLLILPLVFFLFALFHLVYDCRQGIHVNLMTYFGYFRSTWKQALFFGVINLFILLMVNWNLSFYSQFESDWAGIVQLVFVSIYAVWLILQLVMLPIYPRLEEPTYKMALKYSAAIIGGYLFPVGILVILVVAFGALTLSFQFIGIFFTFIFMAVMAEGIIGEVVFDLKESSTDSNPPNS